MPIDPNIALSYRQPEPVNMLGQLGQVMAIKAAQQEMEGYEGVKSALSGGMEATDPRLLQYGKRGIEAFKAANEGRIKQLEAGKKQSELMGNIFGGVLQDPSSGPQALQSLVSMGAVSKDQAAEIMAKAGNDPAAWKALAKPYYDQSIDATKRFQDETERWKANLQAQVTREGHGVQMYGHGISAQRLAMDMKGTYNVVPGETVDAQGNRIPTFAVVNSRTGNISVPGANAPALTMPPPTTTTTPVQNNLQSTLPPQANANALTQPLTASALAPVSLTGQPSAPVQFGPKPTAAQEKQAETNKIKEESKKNVDATLGDFFNKYSDLVKKGAITDTRATTLDNLSASFASSDIGQAFARASGDPAQSIRDSIEQKKPLLVQAIAKATGMSAQQLNSNQELQTYLRAMTDPKISIQSNIDAMNGLSRQFGLGKEFNLPPAGPAPKASSSKSSAANIVEVNGQSFSFPTPEAANEFKKKIGR